MPDFDFQVEIDGDLIVVIDRVTRYYAIYTKPSDRPETLAQGGTPHLTSDETKANGELSSHRGGLQSGKREGARAWVDCVSQKKPGRSWKPGISQQGTLIARASKACGASEASGGKQDTPPCDGERVRSALACCLHPVGGVLQRHHISHVAVLELHDLLDHCER